MKKMHFTVYWHEMNQQEIILEVRCTYISTGLNSMIIQNNCHHNIFLNISYREGMYISVWAGW
jgi:hypothetical protein